MNIPPPTRTFKLPEGTEVEFRLLKQEEAAELAKIDIDLAGHALALATVVKWCVVKPPGPDFIVMLDRHPNGAALADLLACHIMVESMQALFGQIARKN